MWEIFSPYTGKTLGWSRSEWRAQWFILILQERGISADYDWTPEYRLRLI